MNCLRNFVLYCLRNEWITKNPFRYYKLKEDEVQAKEHLTAHELELLSRKALDHRLARIRDVFVFCCLTGLAFADADHLRREHLSQDDEGRWWIHKPREKTSVMSRIPAYLEHFFSGYSSVLLYPVQAGDTESRYI